MAKAATVTTETVEKKEVSKVDHYKGIGMGQLLKEHKNVSGVIRFLKSEGLSTSEIAKVTDKRYQHVRNVLITPVGKKVSE